MVTLINAGREPLTIEMPDGPREYPPGQVFEVDDRTAAILERLRVPVQEWAPDPETTASTPSRRRAVGMRAAVR
jgi:hypothetical protein